MDLVISPFICDNIMHLSIFACSLSPSVFIDITVSYWGLYFEQIASILHHYNVTIMSLSNSFSADAPSV